MSALTAREGYGLWAPSYEQETAVSFLEDSLVTAFDVPVAARRLLDVGCGTGRRLRGVGAALAIGVDASPAMLARAEDHATFAAADLRALPFPAATFDVVWCRLVIGHVCQLETAYAELARVCRHGGMIIVTDFHPDAVAAGHTRTFRDHTGEVHEIEHYVHDPGVHELVGRALGLRLLAHRAGEVGPLVRPFYAHAGRLATYDAHRGLRLVLALLFQRER